MQKKIKIFLGSSQELKISRDEFEKFIRRKNDSWANRDISLQLIIWEDFVDAVSKTRKQDDYNAAIRESDILLILVFSKVGLYTKEEFETGYDQFLKTGNPLIYTYFQYPRIDEGDRTREEVNSIFDFEDRLKQLKHFKTIFKSVEYLQLKFSEQLDKLYPYTLPEPPPTPSSTTGFPQLLTNIPKHDDEFIGREKDLEILKKELEASSKIVLMNGLGGIGKTTLAKKFVQDNLDNYDHVAWVEVKTQDTGHEQNMSITEAFAYNEVLSKSLGLNFINENNEIRFKLIIQALSNLPGKNLLVIDNAREDLNNQDIKDILPRPPKWSILVTSRNSFTGFKVLEIHTLSKDKAKELFNVYYGKPANEKDIEELLEEIGCHTLTIESLAKTLTYPGQKLTVREALEKIKARQLFSPELQRKIELNHSKKETEIYIHLIQTFNLLPLSEKEQWLMKQFYFLLPVANSIDVLETLFNITENEAKKELHVNLHELSKKGWLQVNKEGYFVHRVTQQIIYYELEPHIKDITIFVSRLSSLLYTNPLTNYAKLFFLIPYAEFLLAQLPASDQDHEQIMLLQNNLGIIVKDSGEDKKARDYQEATLRSAIKKFGEQDHRVAISRSNLATTYSNLGEYEKAKDLLELALASNLKNFEEEEQTVILTRSNLASAYSDLGEYEKAKNLVEVALISALKILDEKNPIITICRSNLANIYLNLEEYEKAKDLLELALEGDLKNLGEEHPDTAVTLSNLSSVHFGLKEYNKAKSFAEKSYKIRIAVLGKDHPKTKLIEKNLEAINNILKE